MASNRPEGVPDPFEAARRDDVKGLRSAMPYWDINAQDDDGLTMLHHAALGFAFNAVEFLMAQSGIDPTIVDDYDRTASYIGYEVHGPCEMVCLMSDRLGLYCYPDTEPGKPDLTVLKGAKTDPGRNNDRSHLTFIPGGKFPRFPGPGGT